MREDANGFPGIFQVQDRREGKYILSPTHEEEITTLVGSIVNSYKDLPLKLYQITRKYRDEARPRQGLLRTREFLMKDLYTFDASLESALESYHTTRMAYSSFFDEFKLPYLVAKAASGDMGGDLSHEFHFLTSKGEDNIVSCTTCDYVANEELAEAGRPTGLQKFVNGQNTGTEDRSSLVGFASAPPNTDNPEDLYRQWFGYSGDGRTMVQVIYPTKKALLFTGIESAQESRVNPSMVKQEFPDLNLSIENPRGDPLEATRIFRIYDGAILPPSASIDEVMDVSIWPPESRDHSYDFDLLRNATTVRQLKRPFVYNPDRHLPVYENDKVPEKARSLLNIVDGDRCVSCKDGHLQVRKAVELGHTFHLGTRYTEPLNAVIANDPKRKDKVNLGNDVDEDESHNNCEDSGSGQHGNHLEHSQIGNISKDNMNQTHMQMGCHGIGVSRLIAAAADVLADTKGLNWPRVMAPFEAVVVPAKSIDVATLAEVYDTLTCFERQCGATVDAIIDDREREFGWKLKDADMIGYPVIVVIGRRWRDQKCEVQCRRLKIKEEVPLPKLREFVIGLLDQL